MQSGWMESKGVEGDVLLAAHVTYFVPQIEPFIDKLENSCRRRIIIDVLTVPPPNPSTAFFGLVYGEELAPVPGREALLAVSGEMSVTREVIAIGAATASRPLPAPRQAAS